MKIKQFALNHFETNGYVLWDEESKQCVIVDPCAETTYEEAQVTQYIDEKGLRPKYILLTHAHVDHIAGLPQMCERYGLPVTMHADGKKLLRQAEAYGAVMGFMVESMEGLPVNEVGEDDELEVGKETLPVLPGDRIVSMLPLAHMYGQVCELLYPLVSGCTVYFCWELR